MYFVGSSTPEVAGQGIDSSVYRMRYAGERYEVPQEGTVRLWWEVTIKKYNNLNVTNESKRLRDIIANDVPMDIDDLQRENTIQQEGDFARAQYQATVFCSAYEQMKDRIREVLQSDETASRLQATVSRLGEIDDSFEAESCEEQAPTETVNGGNTGIEGSSPDDSSSDESDFPLIPVVGASVGVFLVVLFVLLVAFIVHRPKRRTVYDLYANMADEVTEPEGIYVPNGDSGRDGRAKMSRNVSFGGQGDII